MQRLRTRYLGLGRWFHGNKVSNVLAGLREAESAVDDEDAGHRPHPRRIEAIEQFMRATGEPGQYRHYIDWPDLVPCGD